MAEAQHDSFEAIAENFAAAQRRSIGIAEGGLEFMRLQEDNARAAQEFFANGLRLLHLQQRNAEFMQGWMGDAVDVMRDRKSTRLNSSHANISYAVFCLKKKKNNKHYNNSVKKYNHNRNK